MVTRIRFCELRELTVIPGKLAGIDNHSTDRVAMTTNVLGSGENGNVGTVLDRSDKTDTGRIVDNEGYPGVMGDLCYCLKIGDIQPSGCR